MKHNLYKIETILFSKLNTMILKAGLLTFTLKYSAYADGYGETEQTIFLIFLPQFLCF